MATSFPFTPQSNQVFTFQPTLDGDQYVGMVTWNPAGQRWYLTLYEATGGALAWTGPVVDSSAASPINMVQGFFTSSTLYYDAPNSQFVTTP